MQPPARRRRSDLEKAQTRAGYLFVLPSFALYAVFVLAPVIVTFVLSFTYYDPMAGSRWVGLENFQRFFTGDRSLQIFWNTLCFAIFAVTGNVTVGLLLALALNRAMPAFLLYLFRLAYFLPVIIAAAFVSIVWGYFYGDDLGVINYYLIRLGLRSGPLADIEPHGDDVDRHHGRLEECRLLHDHLHRGAARRAESHHGRCDHGRGLLLAPVFPYRVAVDLAGRFLRHRLRLDRRAAGLRVDRHSDPGGPGDATRSMSIYIVEEAFGSFEIGYGASVSVIMTLVILIITSIQLVASRRWVRY